MKTDMIRFAAVIFLSAPFFGAVLPTHSAMSADLNYAQAAGSDCSDAGIVSRIISRFHIQTNNITHNPDLAIAELRNIYETRYLPRDVSALRPIARRYCKAQAYMSDGQKRSIWYLLEYRAGFASIGRNVEFCISGLDRWNVYGANCSVLR